MPTFVCPSCGYDLTGTPRAGAKFRCPECGHRARAKRAYAFARLGDPEIRGRGRRALFMIGTVACLALLAWAAAPGPWIRLLVVVCYPAGAAVCFVSCFARRKTLAGNWLGKAFAESVGWVLVLLSVFAAIAVTLQFGSWIVTQLFG
ncbi:MAG: hypothetical protein DHS20C14_22060 [Phycisphaeraceae bacterium]|nr:MAG: hypothetical protein DHS20C14_22060 [Phycisphaeraceae bacterium]